MKKLSNFIEYKLRIPIKTVKYTISSLVSALLEFVLFSLIIYIIIPGDSRNKLIGTIVGRVFGTILNFIINKYWCFHVVNKTIPQLIMFSILFIVKLYLSYIFVDLFSKKFNGHEVLIKMIVDNALFFLGYVVQNFIIFKKKAVETSNNQ